MAPDNRNKWTYHRFGTTYFINDGYSRESGFSDNYKKMKDKFQLQMNEVINLVVN